MQKNYEELVDFQSLTFMEKEHILNQGVIKIQGANFKEIAELSWVELSCLLAVTDRTLLSWSGKTPLAMRYADRFIMYVQLFSFAYYIFNDRDLANTWIKNPCRGLSLYSPLEAMECYPGVMAVEAELKKLRASLNQHV